MSRERELLELAYQYIPLSSITSQEIRAYLAQAEQDDEPEKYGPGMIGFIQYIPDAGMSFTLDEPDDDSYPFEPVYTRPAPRKPFVRLTEEEVNEILSLAYTPYETLCAVENRLVEKNK